MHRILAINLGSTSSKVAYFEGEEQKVKENIEHSADELNQFDNILDQHEYRKKVIIDFLEENQVDYKSLDAVVSRGGHTHPIEGGTYQINEAMLEEIKSGEFGRHACDIGVFIAASMALEGNALAMVVDPPVTDEFEPLAYYSGLPELPRKSSFHALNQRAVGKQYAKETNQDYAKLNLVVVHMGGGISVAAHKKGRMVDANNALTGDGPFSTNRTGTLPVGSLVDMCFSNQFTKAEIKAKLNGKGGMTAYLGENNVKVVQKEALNGNEKYKECLDAMLYQTCKEIGGATTVLKGEIDAILLTGGIVYSEYVVSYIESQVGFLAPIKVYPGEHEMTALALGANRVLTKIEAIKEFSGIERE